MADDIDIEEHDILDDPKMKNIFPHLRVIKSEPLDYEDNYESCEYYEPPHKNDITTTENNDDITIPENDIITPENDMIIPENDITAPGNENPAPGNEIKIQVNENYIIIPENDIITPENDMIKPENDITAPGNEIKIQVNENYIIIPENDMIVPENDMITSENDITALGNDITAPENEIKIQVNENYIIIPENDDDIKEYSAIGGEYPDDQVYAGESTEQSVQLSHESNIYSNRIILGTRPPSGTSMSLILEDWGIRLATSPCYCKECKILFATRNALDAHKMSAHSFLVAIDRPALVEESSRKSDNRKFCNHCQKYFDDDSLLIQHLYDLITAKMLNKSKSVKKPTDTGTSVAVASQKTRFGFVNQCPICYSCFFNVDKLLNHAKECHKLNLSNNQFKVVPAYNVCRFCKKSFRRKYYNSHIQVKHPDKFYLDAYKAKKRDIKIKDGAVKKHQNLVRSKVGDIQKSKNVPRCAYDSDHFLAPRNVLLRCDQCPIHFFHCKTSLGHKSRHHDLPIKEGWLCPICKRRFRVKDKRLHELQHKYTNRFYVYTIHERITARILYRCPKCFLYLDERYFKAHVSQFCGNTFNTGKCNVCNVNINNINHHLLKHTVNKLIKSDFIFIEDFVTNSGKYPNGPNINRKDMNLKRKLPESNTPNKTKRNKVVMKPKLDDKKTVFYYCHYCTTYFIHSSRISFHSAKNCLLDKRRKYCFKCGLLFCAGSLSRHGASHKIGLIHTPTFVRMTDKKPFSPSIPVFPTCKKCGVQYLKTPTGHTCGLGTVKKCQICFKIFTPRTYILHSLHHQYFGKENIKSDLRNLILFSCVACNMSTDSYNRVIEHCQSHINGVNDIVKLTQCENCSLTLHPEYRQRHMDLHSNGSVNKKSFNIIKYNFKSLLTKNWLKIFDSLSKSVMRQILSKSIYSTRLCKMYTIFEGSSTHTLYKCFKCDKFLMPKSVTEHLMKEDCKEKSRGHACPKCKLVFSKFADRNDHKSLHDHLSNDDFRIVGFNKECDKSFNDTLIKTYKFNIKGKKMTSTNFEITMYQCQICFTCTPVQESALSHKCVSQSATHVCKICNLSFWYRTIFSHTEKHKNTKFSKENIKIVPFNARVVLYRCLCGVHFTGVTEIRKHYLLCSTPSVSPQKLSKKTCSVCQLDFPTDSFVSHKHSEFNKFEINRCMFLYKCVVCKFNFCSDNQLKEHIADCENDPKCGELCEKCNLLIHHSAMPSHIKNHTDYDTFLSIYIDFRPTANGVYDCLKCAKQFFNLKALACHFKNDHGCDDIDVNDYGNRAVSTEEAIENNDSIDNSATEENDAGTDQRVNTTVLMNTVKNDNVKSNKIPLFKCVDCVMYFISFSTLMKHIYRGHGNPDMQQECIYCKYTFTNMTLQKHNVLHHIGKNNSRDDFEIFVKDPISTRRYIKEDTDVTEDIEKSTSLMETNDSEDRYVLYKCGECNVYFVKQKSCFNHISVNHAAFDAKEFIECKLCSLPFKLSNLNAHIGLHHEASLNLSKVFVKEYYICDGVVKTRTYYAKDKVQSRLVSTTTDVCKRS